MKRTQSILQQHKSQFAFSLNAISVFVHPYPIEPYIFPSPSINQADASARARAVNRQWRAINSVRLRGRR